MNSLFHCLRKPACATWALLLLAGLLAGCGRNDIQVYRVAKEQPEPAAPAQAAAGMPPGHPDSSAGAPANLKYKVASGWEEVTPGEMRVASFHVKGQGGKQADVSVVPLPGLAGGDLDNVNRWRGQVGLAPVAEEGLSKLAQAVDVAGTPGQLYDLAGQNAGSGEKTRILAAILRREGTAWFFKMTGDDELVAQQKTAFIGFLTSLSFPGGSAQPDLPPSHPPIAGGSPLAASVAASSEGKPSWQVPSGWQEQPGGQFLVAKFSIAGAENAQAAVNVSMSAGDGGGFVGNVNRWRGQLGLGQLAASEADKLAVPVDTAAGKAMFIDMTGTDGRTGQKARLVGAMVPQADRTWFYKLMGNEALVAREKDAFTKFVQTAKYP